MCVGGPRDSSGLSPGQVRPSFDLVCPGRKSWVSYCYVLHITERFPPQKNSCRGICALSLGKFERKEESAAIFPGYTVSYISITKHLRKCLHCLPILHP